MRLNIEDINKQIINSAEVQNQARKIVQQIVDKRKEELINEFNNHPVTRELEAGPNGSNQSGTLGGRGNLFSFIGFADGTSPTEPIKKILNKIRLSSSSVNIIGNNLRYKVEMPSEEEFESVSKMPWESGRSWLYDMEKSISGLGNYLYGKFKNSRSGTGAQSKNNIYNTGFKPVKYFGNMIEKFKQKLNAE